MTGPIENNNDSKTKLPEVFLENFHNVKKQAQHVLKLLGDLVTIEDFETKMQNLCLDVYEEWRHANSFKNDVRDVLHTAAAQSDNPTQLYITILRHYSMNVKGTKDALFRMNMENEKMVNESKLESHIQFDIVLACFLDNPSPIADFPL